jgi:endonuclease YncB( thermonuclease family)
MSLNQIMASVAVLGLLSFTQLGQAAEYDGPVTHIRDGDTFVLRVDGVNLPVRLCGVDSPERDGKGYLPAKIALTELIKGKSVRCVQVGSGTPCDGRSRSTSRDRIVARCFVGDLDIAAEMVRSGKACAWPKFSGSYYRLYPSTCINPN